VIIKRLSEAQLMPYGRFLKIFQTRDPKSLPCVELSSYITALPPTSQTSYASANSRTTDGLSITDCHAALAAVRNRAFIIHGETSSGLWLGLLPVKGR
jgi:hypothetical protein